MNLVFHPRVEDDLADAAAFYESRSAGLGEDFLLELRRTVDVLVEAPERWPRLEGPVRRCLLRRFPFAVFYRADGDRLLVLSVTHTRRRPGSWKDRL